MRYIDKFRAEHPELYAYRSFKPSKLTKVPKAAPKPVDTSRRSYFSNYARLHRKTIEGQMTLRRHALKSGHGITVEVYEQLYAKQAGRCAICGNVMVLQYRAKLDQPKRRGPAPNGAQIDHDHACCPGRKSCGRCVRGLVCSHCNSGLARFRDNPALMRAAADYIERSLMRPESL